MMGMKFTFSPPDILAGKTFDQCKLQVMNISIFGIFTNNKSILLNPDGNTIINSDDKLVAIAEDDGLEIFFQERI